jgi:predicted ferric reductase
MSKFSESRWVENYSGWVMISAVCLLPSLWWLTHGSNSSLFVDAYGWFSGFGKVSGIVGLVLYAVNLLLATRAKWIEGFFGGLNRVYIAHHISGGIALALLVFHPLFLAFRYISFGDLSTLHRAAIALLPQLLPANATAADLQDFVAINAGIIAFLGMVVLLVLTFFVKLPYHIWLFTHKFLGVAFMFAGLHVIFIASDISRDSVLKFYLLSWVVVGLAAFVYRTLLGNILVRRNTYTVTDQHEVAGNVVSITLDATKKPMTYKPGQFVFIRFLGPKGGTIGREWHPFSIASSPKESHLRLLVKSLGDYTGKLKNLPVGTVAEIEGAFGRFTYTRFGPSPQVWIAGGIGVTPFLSMARSFDEKSPQVDMIYSVQTRTELLDQVALADKLPQVFSNFRYHPFVADEAGGFLTADTVEQICGGIKDKEIFICGPPMMMKAIRTQLIAKGIPKNKIHSEEFSMS